MNSSRIGADEINHHERKEQHRYMYEQGEDVWSHHDRIYLVTWPFQGPSLEVSGEQTRTDAAASDVTEED